MTFRSSLSFALLFNAGAAAAVVACGGGGDNTSTGGTGAGATGGSAMAGGAGGASGSAGKGTTTGGVGGATGGVGGGSGGVGGATGGVGGATGGVGGGSGGVGGATGGVGGGVGGATGGVGGATGGVGGTTGGAGGAMGGTAGMTVGGTGGGGTGDCMVMPTATQSENISTVFNVSYTTDLTTVEKGQIDFGLDTTYGFTAPIDPKDMKTPLLGMKTSKSYHYKVTLSGGGKTCSSADATVMTGPLMQGLPKPTITTPGGADKLAGGFMVSEWYAGKQMAFILDKDAELVWWFDPKTVNAQFGDLTRARMSYDGKSMWIAHGNVPSQTGRMVKVNMDGSGGMDLSSSFTGMNHDFTILPDETIYFVAYSSGQCDDVKQYKDGQTTTVMNIGKAFTSGACHANAIEYSKEDDTLVVSELDHDAYVKIKRTGEIVWVLGGGSDNDFTGDAATWDNEHNLEMLGANKMLMFNNGSGSGSTAIELELDPTAKTATKKWFYTASPAIANVVMGDVQRLPNGNTLVTYSTQGVIHEVDANKMLLQSLSWGTGGALGYVIKRPTLYGAPPK